MDQLDRAMVDYLVARRVEPELVRRMFAGDPELVGRCLDNTTAALKDPDGGKPLAEVTRKTREQAARVGIQAAAKANYQAEDKAGRLVDGIFQRTQQLIHRITQVSQEKATGAAWQLDERLRGRDQRVCIFAAIHSATPGMPYDKVAGSLQHVFLNENHPLLKLAVSAAIMGIFAQAGLFNSMLVEPAVGNVRNMSPDISATFPALWDRVRNEYLKAFGWRPEQDILLTKLGLYGQINHHEHNA